MKFGLSQNIMQQLKDLFVDFNKVSNVYIFGSRALGRYTEGSDIDLAVEGHDLGFNDILDIRLKLDDLMLPYKFDIVILDDTIDIALKEHIQRVGIAIFKRN